MVDIDTLIHKIELNLAVMEKAEDEWVIQDGCSWRRIGTRDGRDNDGAVLRPYVARDGHPDMASPYGVLLHIVLAQPNNIRLLLDEIVSLRQQLEDARERNLIANNRADNAEADAAKALAGQWRLNPALSGYETNFNHQTITLRFVSEEEFAYATMAITRLVEAPESALGVSSLTRKKDTKPNHPAE